MLFFIGLAVSFTTHATIEHSSVFGAFLCDRSGGHLRERPLPPVYLSDLKHSCISSFVTTTRATIYRGVKVYLFLAKMFCE